MHFDDWCRPAPHVGSRGSGGGGPRGGGAAQELADGALRRVPRGRAVGGELLDVRDPLQLLHQMRLAHRGRARQHQLQDDQEEAEDPDGTGVGEHGPKYRFRRGPLQTGAPSTSVGRPGFHPAAECLTPPGAPDILTRSWTWRGAQFSSQQF